jgi:hypothetical protein
MESSERQDVDGSGTNARCRELKSAHTGLAPGLSKRLCYDGWKKSFSAGILSLQSASGVWRERQGRIC